jgi:hypothetical protein
MNARSIGIALATVTLCLLPLAAGEESAHEKALKQIISSLDKLTMTLAGIKDAETAQAARPELRKAVMGWAEARKKADKLPPPEPAEKDRLAKQYKGKMDEAVKKFFTEVGRVRGFPAGKEALDEVRPVIDAKPPP